DGATCRHERQLGSLAILPKLPAPGRLEPAASARHHARRRQDACGEVYGRAGHGQDLYGDLLVTVEPRRVTRCRVPLRAPLVLPVTFLAQPRKSTCQLLKLARVPQDMEALEVEERGTCYPCGATSLHSLVFWELPLRLIYSLRCYDASALTLAYCES